MSHTILQTLAQNPMWVYERTYRRLLVLLPPELLAGAQQSFQVAQQYGPVEFSVVEHDRYTLTLRAQQCFREARMVPDVDVLVRIYRDVRIAEVLAYQGYSRSLPYSSMPDAKLLQCVGKKQANQLLLDWLSSLTVHDQATGTDELQFMGY